MGFEATQVDHMEVVDTPGVADNLMATMPFADIEVASSPFADSLEAILSKPNELSYCYFAIDCLQCYSKSTRLVTPGHDRRSYDS